MPAVVSNLLLGSAVPSPEALVFARLAGVALLCIGVASWLSKGAGLGAAQRAQLVGLTIYYALGAVVPPMPAGPEADRRPALAGNPDTPAACRVVRCPVYASPYRPLVRPDEPVSAMSLLQKLT